MTLSTENRDVLIEYRIEKTKEAIADAQFLIDNHKLELAVNRCYYGMFYVLMALALKYQFKVNLFNPEDVVVTDRVNGASRFQRLNPADLKVWLEDDYSPGQLWEKYVIGGGVNLESSRGRSSCSSPK